MCAGARPLPRFYQRTCIPCLWKYRPTASTMDSWCVLAALSRMSWRRWSMCLRKSRWLLPSRSPVPTTKMIVAVMVAIAVIASLMATSTRNAIDGLGEMSTCLDSFAGIGTDRGTRHPWRCRRASMRPANRSPGSIADRGFAPSAPARFNVAWHASGQGSPPRASRAWCRMLVTMTDGDVSRGPFSRHQAVGR